MRGLITIYAEKYKLRQDMKLPIGYFISRKFCFLRKTIFHRKRKTFLPSLMLCPLLNRNAAFYKAKPHDQTLLLKPLIRSSNELTSVHSPN